MISSAFQDGLKAWGVRHRVSSAYYPHSNSRAELAVKSGKRLLRDNMGPAGTLDTDKFMRAVMQFRNTPLQDCNRSPSQMVFGRCLRDYVPSMMCKFEPAKDYVTTQEFRERTLARSRYQDNIKWSQCSKKYKNIPDGTVVSLQNQTGRDPKKWDKTGIVVGTEDFDKVRIKVDGSNRLTTRNRQFVKPISTSSKIVRDTFKPTVDGPVSVRVKEENGYDSEMISHNANDQDMANFLDESVIELQNDEYVRLNNDAVISPTVDDKCTDVSLETTMKNVVGQRDPYPKRARKPNPKYDSETYDLSTDD